MEIQGLPLHVLVVHAVVVLVPLVALGGVAISLLRWARIRYGELVLVGALGALVSTYVAQEAGEAFQKDERFSQPNAEMAQHFAIGDSLLIWVVLLFLGVAAVVAGQWLTNRDNPRGRLMRLVGSGVTIVCAVVAVVQTVRIGHSGAVAVWAV